MLSIKPYYQDFLNIYQRFHNDFCIFECATFYQGRRRLEDIWEFIEQLVFGQRDKLEESDTIKYLIKELNHLS
jgi:hypothetical protein